MATFWGIPGHGHEWGDFSPTGWSGRLDLARDTLRRLDALDSTRPAPAGRDRGAARAAAGRRRPARGRGVPGAHEQPHRLPHVPARVVRLHAPRDGRRLGCDRPSARRRRRRPRRAPRHLPRQRRPRQGRDAEPDPRVRGPERAVGRPAGQLRRDRRRMPTRRPVGGGRPSRSRVRRVRDVAARRLRPAGQPTRRHRARPVLPPCPAEQRHRARSRRHLPVGVGRTAPHQRPRRRDRDRGARVREQAGVHRVDRA